MIIIAGVELTLTGDESTDDSEGMGADVDADVGFWIDCSEKCWILGTYGGEIVFGDGGLKFEEHGWALKDGDTTNCLRWGKGGYSLRCGCGIVDPLVKELLEIALGIN